MSHTTPENPQSTAPVVGHSGSDFSMAIITCTRQRPQSLRRTLESFAAAEREGLALRFLVVDNGPREEAADVARDFQDLLHVRVLREARPGKGNALNRALPEAAGSDVIAVVDDDISVDRRWFIDVCRITTRWPDRGFFAGSLAVAWPGETVPAWARDPAIASWAFSVVASKEDRLVGSGYWASGNCFWFRSSLLPSGFRFQDTWLTEPPLMLDLAERGFGGVISPDAKAWHHIAEDLLDPRLLRQRAITAGKAFAAARLLPYRRTVRQAGMFHRHPLLSRLGCVAGIARWWVAAQLARGSFSAGARVTRQLEAAHRLAGMRQYLATCGTASEYRIRIGRRRSAGRS